MRPMSSIAIVLILLGVLSFFFTDVLITRKEKVVDAGPVQVFADKSERIPLGPIIGGACVLAGVAILLTSRRRD